MSKDTAVARRSFAARSAAARSAALAALLIFLPGTPGAGLLDWAISGAASTVRQMKHRRRRAEYSIKRSLAVVEVKLVWEDVRIMRSGTRFSKAKRGRALPQLGNEVSTHAGGFLDCEMLNSECGLKIGIALNRHSAIR